MEEQQPLEMVNREQVILISDWLTQTILISDWLTEYANFWLVETEKYQSLMV